MSRSIAADAAVPAITPGGPATSPGAAVPAIPRVPDAMRDVILAWYAERGRALAFRATSDPYAILVSEAMAQQTQAARAAEAWERWMAAFPNPVEAFEQFRRVRIPRVHGVQRLSLSNMRFKHMKDSQAQKASIASGTGSVNGKTEWLWGYDPVADWDKDPVVPEVYTR